MKTPEILMIVGGIPALIIILTFALVVFVLYVFVIFLAASFGVKSAQEWFQATFKGLPESMSLIPYS